MEKTILDLEKEAMERWQNGDPMKWAEISAEEITYVDPGITKPVVGIADYVKYLKGLEGKVRYQISEFIDPKISRYGDLAVLTYNYRSAVSGEDGSVAGQTKWNTTEVYCFRKGEWKIIHTHWSYLKHKLPDHTDVPVSVSRSAKPYPGVLGEIMALESAAMERWRRGDPYGFADLSAPDVTYFDTGTPKRLDGLEALKAEYAKRAGKIHYDVMDFIDPRIQVHGDAAVLTYRFLSTSLNPDGSIRSRTPWNCTEVFAKIDGSWKIVHTHWSYINGRQTE